MLTQIGRLFDLELFFENRSHMFLLLFLFFLHLRVQQYSSRSQEGSFCPVVLHLQHIVGGLPHLPGISLHLHFMHSLLQRLDFLLDDSRQQGSTTKPIILGEQHF
uniref:Uncharacterized protein n=1 Tax=Cacopsylla melanoneura TaxID=428564 RepID=A0A8D8ZEA4_9HEMI